jgi:hypothetical protein
VDFLADDLAAEFFGREAQSCGAFVHVALQGEDALGRAEARTGGSVEHAGELEIVDVLGAAGDFTHALFAGHRGSDQRVGVGTYLNIVA